MLSKHALSALIDIGMCQVIKALLADSYNVIELPRAMALREAAGTAAYIVGPTLGGCLLAFGGIASVAYFGAFLSLCAIPLLLLVPERPLPKAARPRKTLENHEHTGGLEIRTPVWRA